MHSTIEAHRFSPSHNFLVTAKSYLTTQLTRVKIDPTLRSVEFLFPFFQHNSFQTTSLNVGYTDGPIWVAKVVFARGTPIPAIEIQRGQIVLEKVGGTDLYEKSQIIEIANDLVRTSDSHGDYISKGDLIAYHPVASFYI